MLDEAKAIVIGAVGTAIKEMGIKCSSSQAEDLLKFENWNLSHTKEGVIDYSTSLLYEYKLSFMQIELKIQHNTVVSINIITDPFKRISYS